MQASHPNSSHSLDDNRADYSHSKHMDKHDRPHRCQRPECAKLAGFTYSDGLLRHERESHRKQGGRKEQLKCSVPGCKRRTGKGFMRQDNLDEHLRRVHGFQTTTPTLGRPEAAPLSANTLHDDFLEEIGRLKRDSLEKDELIRRMESNAEAREDRLQKLEESVVQMLSPSLQRTFRGPDNCQYPGFSAMLGVNQESSLESHDGESDDIGLGLQYASTFSGSKPLEGLSTVHALVSRWLGDSESTVLLEDKDLVVES